VSFLADVLFTSQKHVDSLGVLSLFFFSSLMFPTLASVKLSAHILCSVFLDLMALHLFCSVRS